MAVELKNAVAVCLISLFSASLVVMIVRAIDSENESRIERQLAAIVEELQAIRSQGGIPQTPTAVGKSENVDDGLIVYYFHSNARCATCQAIESQSHEMLQADFAAPLKEGKVVWKVLNYEQPAVKPLAEKFEILMPVVVLAKMKGGKVQDWKRLDEVWGLVGDKPAFAAFLRGEIGQMRGTAQGPARPASASGKKAAKPAAAPPDLPLPAPSLDLPAPK
jgi:hypothetical protein